MTGWEDLENELDAWHDEDRVATLWWRDDDAVQVTPALETLLGISSKTETPIALAVVPGRLEDGLQPRLDGEHGVCVLQHGFEHVNHAPADAKASEFGSDRSRRSRLADIAAGLKGLSGFRFRLPVFVPPWNRIGDDLLSDLPGLGLRGISTFAPRSAASAAPGLTRVNTHVDIIGWRQGRRFVGVAAALEMFIEHFRARRTRTADPDEPTGLLTHHLDHDDQCWSFIGDFLRATQAHPAARWLEAKEAFEF